MSQHVADFLGYCLGYGGLAGVAILGFAVVYDNIHQSIMDHRMENRRNRQNKSDDCNCWGVRNPYSSYSYY